MITAALVAVLAALVPAVAAADVRHPTNPVPSWFTDDFKQKVDASGPTGVPVDDHQVYDVCPGAVIHENGVGTGTCLVVPAGCTANFVYYAGGGTIAGRVSSGGAYYLGTAGHCVDKVGEAVYGAVSTPGVLTAIRRIGTVSKFVNDYPDNANFHDFAAIKLDDGQNVYPDSPVGGPNGIYDGCAAGQPLKFYGHGYEVAVAQGKPGAGVSTVFYDDNYGWAGLINGGDSGSGVLHGDGRAVGNLTATTILYPPWLPGESVGSRVTWILSFLGSGYSLVNADYTLARDTTSSCGTPDSGDDGGGGGGGNGGGNGGGKGGGDKGGGDKGGGDKGGKPKS
jgi:hypothetical protein